MNNPSNSKPHVIVVGSGISGLSTAWHLREQAKVTVLEASDRLGGHTHTRMLSLDGLHHPVDTGFIVFNHRTYPEFRPWLAELGVKTQLTEMSFSVTAREGALEWSGQNLRTVFAQKRNLLSPSFWRMLWDILRFNRQAPVDRARMVSGELPTISLGQYLIDKGYSQSFQEGYLLPMAGAIWSCPADQMKAFPFQSFVAFCENHGLLQVNNRPPWYTLTEGSNSYITALAARFARDGHEVSLQTGRPVTKLEALGSGRGVRVLAGGEWLQADAVVLACHSTESLALLAPLNHPATDLVRQVGYQPNTAYLHTDTRLMPKRKAAWAAWNYRAEGQVGDPVSVTYWMNCLQQLPFQTPVLVSLNPLRPPAPELTLETLSYEHPILDGPAVAAQAELPKVQGQGSIWLAGAWTGFGFHEDGFRSGRLAAEGIQQALGLRR